MYSIVKPLETPDDCFYKDNHFPYFKEARAEASNRVKRLQEEEAKVENKKPCDATKSLAKLSTEVASRQVVEQMLDSDPKNGTDSIVAELVSKGKAEDIVKAIVLQGKGRVKEVVKGLMSTRAGIVAIPKVRAPKMQSVVVVMSVNDEGLIKEPPGYIWLNRDANWLLEMFDKCSNGATTELGALGGFALDWTKFADAQDWVTTLLGSLECDQVQCVYVDAGFYELEEDCSDRDDDGENEYDRMMDNQQDWNQNNYQDYGPRFGDMMRELFVAHPKILTPQEVHDELTDKNQHFDIMGTITINKDSQSFFHRNGRFCGPRRRCTHRFYPKIWKKPRYVSLSNGFS